MPKKIIVSPSIEISENKNVESEREEYYDVLGRKVEKLGRGVYFVVRNGKVGKVIRR